MLPFCNIMLDNRQFGRYSKEMEEVKRTSLKKTNHTEKSLKVHNKSVSPKLGLLGKSIISSLKIGVITFEPDLKIIEANPQAEKLIKIDKYIDKSLAQCTKNTGTPGLDWTKQLKSALSTGQTRRFDNIGLTTNGQIKLLSIACIPLKQTKTQGNPGGSILIENVTEKDNIQKQLADTERLATIGRLTSKIAHELNSPMDGILRYINLAARIVEQENLEKPKEYLARSRQGLMRMVQILSELLEFSRSSSAPFEYAKIEQIIEDAIKAMESVAQASNIQILRNYTEEIPQIKSGNLFQVFCNVIKNAFEAMPNSGQLYISTRLSANNLIITEFHDTGNSFASKNTELMFEPFFTTKDKGTGLGLAICRDILEKHNGRITAKNALKGGSIFSVYLPLADYA